MNYILGLLSHQKLIFLCAWFRLSRWIAVADLLQRIQSMGVMNCLSNLKISIPVIVKQI